ncbi:hypothetical protein SH611_11715 [Geminicoccaceae bacterium 1502E]|nr:hypothetical protein [Geminicoccaceae bacterium 1502E]
MAQTALLARQGDVVRVGFGRPAAAPTATPAAGDTLARWLRAQAINGGRAALLIRPFRKHEFGSSAAAPSPAHLLAANALMARLRRLVVDTAVRQRRASEAAIRRPAWPALAQATRVKDEVATAVAATEKVWQFYWDMFNQRQSVLADRLLAADRVALDCYQYTYGGLGTARSIPTPAPLAYMESGLGPATFRRGVLLTRLGRLPNPFPLVKLPYHRLVCPWTLGAIPHEVAHNLQSDLGLWMAVPKVIYRKLRKAGIEPSVAKIWMRWHKETFADLLGVLLIGPSFIGSLMDVVAKAPERVAFFHPKAVHPTPFLRVLINAHLLDRIGFPAEARAYREAWLRLYPPARLTGLPAPLWRSFPRACRLAVEAIAFTPYPQLGGKRLAEVVAFRPQDERVASEAAGRLARGRDPGIVPERFLIAAARIALDRRLAPPDTIARHFYEALGRR